MQTFLSKCLLPVIIVLCLPLMLINVLTGAPLLTSMVTCGYMVVLIAVAYFGRAVYD
jgi:hypothetical protein